MKLQTQNTPKNKKLTNLKVHQYIKSFIDVRESHIWILSSKSEPKSDFKPIVDKQSTCIF